MLEILPIIFILNFPMMINYHASEKVIGEINRTYELSQAPVGWGYSPLKIFTGELFYENIRAYWYWPDWFG